jgi:hypothetical protein
MEIFDSRLRDRSNGASFARAFIAPSPEEAADKRADKQTSLDDDDDDDDDARPRRIQADGAELRFSSLANARAFVVYSR